MGAILKRYRNVYKQFYVVKFVHMGKPRWCLTADELNEQGFSIERLKAGSHEKVSHSISLKVFISLSQHVQYEQLSDWWAQLTGVNADSLSKNKSTVQSYIDRLKKKVRQAQISRGKISLDDVFSEPVSFPPQNLDDLATFDNSVVTELRREAEFFRAVTNEVANENAKLNHDLLNANRRARYARKRRHDGCSAALNEQQVVNKTILRCLKQVRKEKKTMVPLSRLKSAQVTIQKLQKKTLNLNRQIVNLRSEVNDAHNMLLELKDTIENGRLVLTKDGSCFNANMREMVMRLVAAKVPFSEVGTVLTTVSDGLGVRLSDTPSARTVSRIATNEMVAVAQRHLAEVLPNEGDLCLLSDETSKAGKQSFVTAAGGESGQCYLLSLREIGDKSGGTMLAKVKETLEDLGKVSGKDPVSFAGELFLQLKNTQSDRAATCVKLNEMIDQFRQEIAPYVVKNWDLLDEQEKNAILKVRNFYCGLHLLVNFADTLTSVLAQFETVARGQETRKGGHGEPGVYQLVRNVCKMFAIGGKDNVSHYQQFKMYLKQHAISLPQLCKFKGNRFNVIFVNAEIAFLARRVVAEYLRETGSDTWLSKSILNDFQKPVLMAELRVLGLIGKTITSPLWRILESDVHISVLSEIYSSLLRWLTEQAINPAKFLAGESPFPTSELVKDASFAALVEPDVSLDTIAESIAKVSLQALANYLQRAVCDQLPGGANFNLDDDLQATTSVPKTNKFPESIFGFLDQLIHKRPNATMLANEALILFIKNGTGAWLNSKSTDEREQILKHAHADQQRICEESSSRREAVEAVRANKLAAKISAQKKHVEYEYRRNTQLLLDIQKCGLWQYRVDVTNQLLRYQSDSAKRDALKMQLRFRKFVLRQPPPDGDSSIYAFSVKGQQLSIAQLQTNLLSLIEGAQGSGDVGNVDDIFVGRTVEHFIHDSQNWYRAYVIDAVPGFPTFYNYVYDRDPETVYTRKLHDDMLKGEVRILSEAS